MNLNRIQTQDMEENIGGWRADEKAGFKYEGRYAKLFHASAHTTMSASIAFCVPNF